ncbi:hypothetical protein MmiHf6_02470 [Methanimicrococcus hongohii]|uniref:AAA+ ATPase domain-containing protein n=1 Tax=Methanimicrococcus hongohii TaxID=3028295 RepID=A0AA96V0X2_9EURY|nr:AAA family ATPase [Methanimicrococcus sp. Hf6]WNY22953.1 hypothetical protein MmiHf6_02470 [Methanimicrococcus sp. Hf6]
MSVGNAINKINREVGIKKCIIIDGNTADVFLHNRRIVTIKDLLIKNLAEQGCNDVIYWDRISGLEGNLSNLCLAEPVEETEGEEYDFGEDDFSVPAPSLSGACKDVSDMLNVVLRTMSDETRKTVFILNWTEYLFSTGQLDPADRQSLTLLGKSLRDLPPRHNSTERESAVILITNKVSSLPLSFYNGNPEVSQVTITKPDRNERKEMIERIAPGFSLKNVTDITDSERLVEFVDMMSDFTNREIIQMANMSRIGERMTFDKLFYLFKYGETENPWEKLDAAKVKSIKKTLSERVIGQENAVNKVEDVIVKAFMGLTGMHKASSKSMPKGVLFFVGPTGVGKTELSKAIAKFLFGEESACIRFDMSEYVQPNSDQKLIGAPPGYVGYEEGGQLTNAIREKPFSVILFDEIEKAAKPNPRILDIFLQILEDGRLTDSRGETTYFTDTIIIFTSNLGASEISYSSNKEQVSEDFIQVVKEYFDHELGRPELLGRIGYSNIVPFNFIDDPEFTMNIARSKMEPIREGILEKYKIKLEIENEIKFFDYILKGADTSKGGRDILNALNDRLLSPLSKFLFMNYDDLRSFKGATLLISVESDKLRFDFDE